PVRVAFGAWNRLLSCVSLNINELQGIVANVGVQIPTLRVFRMLVGERLVGACKSPLGTAEVSLAEVIEARFRISFFARKLPTRLIRRRRICRSSIAACPPIHARRNLLSERQVVVALYDLPYAVRHQSRAAQAVGRQILRSRRSRGHGVLCRQLA